MIRNAYDWLYINALGWADGKQGSARELKERLERTGLERILEKLDFA